MIHRFQVPIRIATAVAAIVLLVAMAPFGPALDVHHLLAEADHDGHQHSDFDLCQWVQHHGTSAPALFLADLGRPFEQYAGSADALSGNPGGSDPASHPSPRGPPLS